MSLKRALGRALRTVWMALDTLRRVLHLLLLLPLLVLIIAALIGDRQIIPSDAALVVAPGGILVEELEGAPFDRALRELQGGGPRQTLLRDVTDSLSAAAEDDRIRLVVLSLDELQGGGLAKLRAVAAAIGQVRDAGKPVIAVGSSFSQDQYYLAAHADEILLHELGVLYVDGYDYYRTFFRGALERLRIDLNVFRVGEFKSFVEPYIRDDMSSEDRAASRRWLNDLWAVWQQDVERARGLEQGTLARYADGFAELMAGAAGDTAQVALNAGLVDQLLSRPAMEKHIAGRLGNGTDRDFEQIGYQSYLRVLRRTPDPAPFTDEIGVVVASGVIMDGPAAPGTIGGDSLARQLRIVAEDDAIRAVVLRIDSPGGSMFASEVIAAEVDQLKARGKPVVASMSSVAASGGYYIAMAADEIWASEATITGSIGVGAIFPTVQRSLEGLGITVDGVGTTALSGQLRLDRPLGDDARAILELGVEDAYRVFVGKVAKHREMSYERADNLARGRVWAGLDARELGLVDELGDLDAAIASAARRAGLEEGAYRVRFVAPELTLGQRLALQFAGGALTVARQVGWLSPGADVFAAATPAEQLFSRLRERFEAELGQLALLNDPRGLYYHCFCTESLLR